jgi:hypothetical protein
MVWITMPRLPATRLRAVLDEIDTGSHRATALVAAAFVEEHLTLLIRDRIQRDSKLEDQMFRPGAPLGDMGVKINLGYFLGLYTKAAWRELDTIRRIRNAFAHTIEMTSFNESPVKDWCMNLNRWRVIKIRARRGSRQDLMLSMEDDEDKEGVFPIIGIKEGGSKNRPYDRYLVACQFYIGAFTILSNTDRSLLRSKPIF